MGKYQRTRAWVKEYVPSTQLRQHPWLLLGLLFLCYGEGDSEGLLSVVRWKF